MSNNPTYVKIVATIGPKTNNAASLQELINAGINIARLNGSHSNLEWHAATIALIRSVAPAMPIIFDIPGRKIRTHQLAHEPSFTAGDTVVLTTDTGYDGSTKVPLNRSDLHEHLHAGDVLYADDGTLKFTIIEITGRDIRCRADVAGTLRSAKGINVPSVNFPQGPLTERDLKMISFAREHSIDFVGISFVDRAQQVNDIRNILGSNGPQVLSKVENLNAMNNLDEVIAASDAIMIDRGDLSVETNLESIAIFQKRILAVAKLHRKPVIVATEMLHTMIENPFPTKAEVTDISNAVLDGASALMLSGETAIGRFPSQTVALMRRVADTVCEFSQGEVNPEINTSIPQAMGEAISILCQRLPVTKIVVVTVSGNAAKTVANMRPRQPILAVSNSPAMARSLNLLFGTTGIYLDIPFLRTSTDHIASSLEELWRRKLLTDEDIVLVTAVSYPKSGNLMNMIQSHSVSDLRESLGWIR